VNCKIDLGVMIFPGKKTKYTVSNEGLGRLGLRRFAITVQEPKTTLDQFLAAGLPAMVEMEV
jgi:hypothetical protein